MANSYRRGFAYAMISGVIATLAFTATATPTSATEAGYSNGWGAVTVNAYVSYDAGPAYLFDFDMRVAPQAHAASLLAPSRQHRDRVFAVKPSRFGQAVRPSAVAGWRSGRVRHLAAA